VIDFSELRNPPSMCIMIKHDLVPTLIFIIIQIWSKFCDTKLINFLRMRRKANYNHSSVLPLCVLRLYNEVASTKFTIFLSSEGLCILVLFTDATLSSFIDDIRLQIQFIKTPGFKYSNNIMESIITTSSTRNKLSKFWRLTIQWGNREAYWETVLIYCYIIYS